MRVLLLFALFLILVTSPYKALGGSIRGIFDGFHIEELLAGIDRNLLDDEQELELATLLLTKTTHFIGMGLCIQQLAASDDLHQEMGKINRKGIEIPKGALDETLNFPKKPLRLIRATRSLFASLIETPDNYILSLPDPFNPLARTVRDILGANLDTHTRNVLLQLIAHRAKAQHDYHSANLAKLFELIGTHLSPAAKQQPRRTIPVAQPDEEPEAFEQPTPAPRQSTPKKEVAANNIVEITRVFEETGKLPTAGKLYTFIYIRLKDIRAQKKTFDEAFVNFPQNVKDAIRTQMRHLYDLE